MDASDIQNAMTFLGILVLAVPVWSLNLRKKSLHKIEQVIEGRSGKNQTGILDDIDKIVKSHGQRSVANWRPCDQFCLIVGYLLLLGGSGWRLFSGA